MSPKIKMFIILCTFLGACNLKSGQLNKKQRGRSMIEMLGVLAIVGILSAGGIAGYSMAMQSHKTNALIDKIQLIVQKTREFYNGEYEQVRAERLIDSGMLKDLDNPFGGSFSIWFGTLPNGSGCFYITTNGSLSNIPEDSCVKILTTYWGDSGVFWGISTDHYTSSAFSYSRGNYPVSVQDAISACKGGNKMIKWWFR